MTFNQSHLSHVDCLLRRSGTKAGALDCGGHDVAFHGIAEPKTEPLNVKTLPVFGSLRKATEGYGSPPGGGRDLFQCFSSPALPADSGPAHRSPALRDGSRPVKASQGESRPVKHFFKKYFFFKTGILYCITAPVILPIRRSAGSNKNAPDAGEQRRPPASLLADQWGLRHYQRNGIL